MRDEWNDFIEREMMKDSERILEEVNADPMLKDVQAPEKMHDILFAQIREYEERRIYEQLSEADKELIRLGKVYKRKRKCKKYLILVAAVIAVLALGTVCIGEEENVFRAISTMFGKKEQTEINSKNIEPIMYVDEIEAYEKIEETYGFVPVELEYLPEKTVFCEAVFSEDMQYVNMIYEKENESSILYIIRPNYRESSIGTVIEDKKMMEYEMVVNDIEITVKEYSIVEKQQNKWAVSFAYEDVQYLLRINNMEQEVVERIIYNLGF